MGEVGDEIFEELETFATGILHEHASIINLSYCVNGQKCAIRARDNRNCLFNEVDN